MLDTLIIPLQITIDRYLAHDAIFAGELAEFGNKVVVFELRGWGVMTARLGERGVDLFAGEPSSAEDARIVGSPLGLIALARQSEHTTSNVTISGDVQLAMKLKQLMAFVDIDIEEILASRIGDANAHRVVRGLRATSEALHQARRGLMDSVSEYAHEEAKLLPTRAEMNAFCQGVSDCQNALSRVQARLDRMEQG